MTSRPGKISAFSIRPPVFSLSDLNGGNPNLIGRGRSQGTPSVVNESVIR